MRYSVGPDRYATNVEPVDPDAPPEAVDFAKRRLQSCPFPADAKPSGQWRYRFHAPREDGAVPELLREGIDRPEPRCGPAPPRAVPGHTGTVLANYVVETDGSVLDLDVMNPGADEALWDSVRSWLTSCRFKPAMRDGKPLPVIVIQPFIFR